MKFFTADVQAGETISIGAAGRYFRLLEGDGDITVTFETDNGNGARTAWKVGLGGRVDQDFKRLMIHSSITQRIVIAYSKHQIDDSRLTGSLSISGGLSIKANKTVAHGAVSVTTTATLVRAENLGRGRCLLQNLGGAACYVGSTSGVTASNGMKVLPGGTMEVSFDDTVYAITASGTADVRYLEETV
ncbi:hypothetical protein HBA55_34425 [Pseudomaricurvus alkylphenolicus]|uniref:hypothetical protein n=1 Tax=Pseudomaricurvus alkylphenolicus TaxID=1306991 RepID=UPI00141F2946|nr:hypothetical protein [Pseudomaricurvus alkylphenolicus]NIB44727.1 hypothetical protein [Pseudomaricurvus alkylphenolicus]